MNASRMKNLVHMHTLKAEIKNKQRKSGRTLQRMEMLKTYAIRLQRTRTDTILPSREEIDALFEKYPSDDSLKEVFAYSEWVRVRGEEGKAEYLIGVIYDDMKAKYICYALPVEDKERPPEEIKEICTFVPSSAFTDKEGFFVIFQSCSTGECIRPESL